MTDAIHLNPHRIAAGLPPLPAESWCEHWQYDPHDVCFGCGVRLGVILGLPRSEPDYSQPIPF